VQGLTVCLADSSEKKLEKKRSNWESISLILLFRWKGNTSNGQPEHDLKRGREKDKGKGLRWTSKPEGSSPNDRQTKKRNQDPRPAFKPSRGSQELEEEDCCNQLPETTYGTKKALREKELTKMG